MQLAQSLLRSIFSFDPCFFLTGTENAETKVDSVFSRRCQQVQDQQFFTDVEGIIRLHAYITMNRRSFSFTADGTPLHVGMEDGHFFFYTKDVSILIHLSLQGDAAESVARWQILLRIYYVPMSWGG